MTYLFNFPNFDTLLCIMKFCCVEMTVQCKKNLTEQNSVRAHDENNILPQERIKNFIILLLFISLLNQMWK